MRTTLLAVVFVVGCASLAQGRPQDQQPVYPIVPLISRYDQQDPAGAYRTVYETANGIIVDETGYLEPTDDGLDVVLSRQGSYRYTSPDGTVVYRTYIANKNGFQAQGNDLPQPVQPIAPTFA